MLLKRAEGQCNEALKTRKHPEPYKDIIPDGSYNSTSNGTRATSCKATVTAKKKSKMTTVSHSLSNSNGKDNQAASRRSKTKYCATAPITIIVKNTFEQSTVVNRDNEEKARDNSTNNHESSQAVSLMPINIVEYEGTNYDLSKAL